MKESEIWKQVLLALASLRNVRLFRNNVGTGWTGSTKRLSDGSMVISQPRPLNAGLVKGSGDGIGWRTIEITPDMVGQKIAQFVSVETKTKSGRVSREQQIWLDNVNAAGGLAVVVRSAEEAIEALK